MVSCQIYLKFTHSKKAKKKFEKKISQFILMLLSNVKSNWVIQILWPSQNKFTVPEWLDLDLDLRIVIENPSFREAFIKDGVE